MFLDSCRRVQLHAPEVAPSVPRCATSCVHGLDHRPGVGAWQLPDLRHYRTLPGRSTTRPTPAAAAIRAATSSSTERALSRQPEGCRRGIEIRQGAARDRTAVPGGCGAGAGDHRKSRQQGCCSPAMAARWPTTATSSRPSTCSAAPIAPTIPIGGCSRRRERHWINLAAYEEARQYYASALKIVPDEPSVLSNLGLSYVLSKESAQGGGNAAASP